MEGVPALWEIGVTDFSRPWIARSSDQRRTEAGLRTVVDAFRATTGRH
jgi:hypothetical protein